MKKDSANVPKLEDKQSITVVTYIVCQRDKKDGVKGINIRTVSSLALVHLIPSWLV